MASPCWHDSRASTAPAGVALPDCVCLPYAGAGGGTQEGVNAACKAFGVAGGGGTPFRRTGKPCGEGASARTAWERFDRGAAAIQVLNLAMGEDITHRYDLLSLAAGNSPPGEAKLQEWLEEEHPRQGQVGLGGGAGRTCRDLKGSLVDLGVQMRRDVERQKCLAVANLESGLVWAWDRRTETGWEQGRPPHQPGHHGVAWERHPHTAAALILLLRGARQRGDPTMGSSNVLKEAADLVRKAVGEGGLTVD